MNGAGRFPAAAMVQPAYTNGNGFPNGYFPAYRNGGLNGGVGLQPGAGGKGVIPAGYGETMGAQPSYVNGGVGLQTGAGGKGVIPAGYGAGGFPAAAGLLGAGTFPGVQVATSYGNGYPGLLADGGAYGAKAGKGLGQALYGAQPGLTNGLGVAPAAGKYGAGLPYNGQPLVPAGLGASQLPYGVPEAGLRLLGDPSGMKYGNGQLQTGFLGTGPSQGMAAGGYRQLGVGQVPDQLGAKEGKYPLNGYFGNGYGGCPPGKCVVQGKK
ncbi:elastin-like [Heterodontus francisci]|uniref:elastin-like n=1 Tax=Heterodontus francisci TaxID=7792 RepID=UPI00355B9AD4